MRQLGKVVGFSKLWRLRAYFSRSFFVNNDASKLRDDVLVGGGEMGELMRAYDWAASPVGAPEYWPQPLQTTIRLMLTTRHPMFIFWGSTPTYFCNDAYRERMHPDQNPLAPGQSARAFFWDIWAVIGPQINQLMEGGDATWHEDQLVATTRNGNSEDVWWTYGCSPIPNSSTANGVGGVLIICNDMTRDHMTRKALQRAERQTRHALSAADCIGTWEWDVENDRVYADANFARIYGVDPSEAAEGVPLSLFTRNIYAEDKSNVETAIAESIKQEKDFKAEYRLLQQDGSVRWVAVSGSVFRATKEDRLIFPGVAIDITDRKRSEEKLSDSNRNLLNLLSKQERDLRDSEHFAKFALSMIGGVGIWTYYRHSNRYFGDEAFLELFAIDVDQAALGIPPSVLFRNVHPEDLVRVQTIVSNALKHTADVEIEYRICHPDGSTRCVLGRGHNYMDESGYVTRRTGVAIDVTKQRILF